MELISRPDLNLGCHTSLPEIDQAIIVAQDCADNKRADFRLRQYPIFGVYSL